MPAMKSMKEEQFEAIEELRPFSYEAGGERPNHETIWNALDDIRKRKHISYGDLISLEILIREAYNIGFKDGKEAS